MNGSLPFDEDAARDLARRHFARARNWTRSANHHRAIEQRNQPPALTAITVPALVIVGEADPIFPPPHAEALVEGIPGALAVRVPGMGHSYLSPGLPEHLADLILDFIPVRAGRTHMPRARRACRRAGRERRRVGWGLWS